MEDFIYFCIGFMMILSMVALAAAITLMVILMYKLLKGEVIIDD